MTRQVAFLIWASKGGLGHETIMKLTWRQFLTYLDAFGWLMNEQSDKGQEMNRLNDLKASAGNEQLKERKRRLIEETKAKVAKHMPKR